MSEAKGWGIAPLLAVVFVSCTSDDEIASRTPPVAGRDTSKVAGAVADTTTSTQVTAAVSPDDTDGGAAATDGGAGDGQTPTVGGDADLAAALLGQGDNAAMLASAKVTVPQDWKGTGVLARATQPVPKKAPTWARIALEVVERDGKRLLLATGRADKIKDPYLARTTAEQRARVMLGRATGTVAVRGGVIDDAWRDPRTGEIFVRAQMEVPPGWKPAGAP